MIKQVPASRVRSPAKNALAQTFVFHVMQTYISSFIQRTATVHVMLIEAGTLRKANILGHATAFKNSTLLIKSAQIADHFSQDVLHVHELVTWTITSQKDSIIRLTH